jgi:fructosamine-3-kinase
MSRGAEPKEPNGPDAEQPRPPEPSDAPELVELVPIRGGDINRAFRGRTIDGRTVFVKTRDDPPPGMFAAEAASLRWLRDADAIHCPEPLWWDEQRLVLEWIDHGAPGPATDEDLGRGLAALHRAGAFTFGLAEPANLATIPLDNAPTATWPEFLWTRRLEPLLRIAGERGAVPTDDPVWPRLEHGLDELCGPPEPPARLHGDLWSGNVVVDRAAAPWLVDPSSYGGHREIDLAMLALFGGLSERIVSAYDAVFPLCDGWRRRVPLNQLLPLLVHAVLFGGSYGRQALTAARSAVAV